MNMINQTISIELNRDENLNVVLTDTIRCGGMSPKNCGLIEGQGLCIEVPWMEIPLFAGDQMVLRIYVSDPEDNYIDAEILQCEYSEFEGCICRLHKESFTVYTWIAGD